VFDAGIDTRTKLARNYFFHDPEHWTGLYHTLEPFTAVRYTNRSSYDDIPLFDRLDALDGRDVATYGIDSRFLLRRVPTADKPGGPFEFARISLSQTYNLTRNVVDDNFSDIDLAGFLQPFEGFAVRTLTSYNAGASQIRGANASLSWEPGSIPYVLRGSGSQIAVAYRYVRSDQQPSDDQVESAEMLARLAFTRNIALGLKGLYDIVGNTFVETGVGLTFTSSCDCWSVGLGVVNRVNPSVAFGDDERGNPKELQVRLAFELKGLGGFGSGVAQRNSPALDSVEYEDVGFWRAGW
jgi:lipopolysaccharide assembly outer membrane protein LptD (OstA)